MGEWIGAAPEDTPIHDLVEPTVVVSPDSLCDEIDRGFRGRWTGSSILVRPVAPGQPYGVVGRHDFFIAMTGRYGFGRSIWARRAIETFTRWDAPCVESTASLTGAASLLTGDGAGYTDMIVTSDGVPIGILQPTTLMTALANELARRVASDQLTGTATRSVVVEHLRRTCHRARCTDGAVLVAFWDLDRLKQVNDTLGHAHGDALLASVARSVTGCLAQGDVLGRLGGDEFAVTRYLPRASADTWREQAVALGESIRLAVATPDRSLPPGAHSTASVGVAIGAGPDLDADHLLGDADSAMYAAKKAGRNRVRLVGSPGEAARSLDTDELEVVYQPIVTTDGPKVESVEALLRIRRPDGSLGAPGPALVGAAQDGLDLELDLWVLDRAARDLARWSAEPACRAPWWMNVNLAAGSLAAPDLADRILATIDASGLDRRRVRLELSESSSQDELLGADHDLHRLRLAGVQIALDDVGSTLTSLRHLTRLPLDLVKIDRSVVSGMLSDEADSLIVDLLCRVAEGRGLALVAEGVEQPDQLAALDAAGVRLVQGFLLARPMPETELRRLLSAHTGRSADADGAQTTDGAPGNDSPLGAAAVG